MNLLYFITVEIFLVSIAAASQNVNWAIDKSEYTFVEDASSIKCVQSGPTCSTKFGDCGKSFLCLPKGENEWNVIETKCQNGKTCNNGECSYEATDLCLYGDKNFVCNAIGVFPDPRSCKGYNFCVPNVTNPDEPILYKAECGKGYGYNPATTFCDISLDGDQCTDEHKVFDPTCRNLADNNSIRGNDVLYFICLPYSDTKPGLYPFLFMCPNGNRYLGNFVCQE